MTITIITRQKVLNQTIKDVKNFMGEYEIHKCYKTKIKQFIKDYFNTEIDKKVIPESEEQDIFFDSPRQSLDSPRQSLGTKQDVNQSRRRSKMSPQLVSPRLGGARGAKEWETMWEEKLKKLREETIETNLKKNKEIEKKKLLEVKNKAARVILNKLWKNILTTFDLVVKKEWHEYDWNNMTNTKNIENGLNIVFWIFRQIAVNFLLYFYSLLFGNSTFKMTSMGSVAVTSDYDISISSDKSAAFTRLFNLFFESLGEGKTSGIIFDTNIYAHPIVEDIESEESNNCYEYHKMACKFLKAPKFSTAFLQQGDRIAAILMYYKYFGTMKGENDLEYITYQFLKRNFSKWQKGAEKKYEQLRMDEKSGRYRFKHGDVTNRDHQDKMNVYYEDIANEIQNIKTVMNQVCQKKESKEKDIEKLEQEKLYDLLNKMTDLQFFGNETLLSVSAFLHVVVYLQGICTDHVFSGCRKTIINKENAKFIYLNSFIENLCFMTTHFKDIQPKGLKKIMKYLYRACDALVEYFNSVNKTPTEELIKIHKITKQWQQNKNKGEPEKMTENVKKLEKFIIKKDIKKDIKEKIKFLMSVFEDNLNPKLNEEHLPSRNFYIPNECKIDNDCESKCCKDNQCVDGSVCEEEKEREEGEEIMIRDQKRYDKAKKKEKQIIEKYQEFESQAIASIKNLAAQIDKPSSRHTKSEHKRKLISLYRKKRENILDHYNKFFAKKRKEWKKNEIPEEILIHINFVKKRIFDNTPTPSPEDSQTFSEEEIQQKSKSKTPPKSKSPKKSKVISGGKKKKVIRKNKKKKVRKHQGISQTGGNIGKLKKGFRYSGKKLKSGLPQIIKCKQTNKSKK